MRGIPTMHDGIQYRSMLEAKWASFFTRIGWRFEYEPFEGNGYIPDFVVYGTDPMAVEVKPAVSLQELEQHTAKVEEGLRGLWGHDILIVGASPAALTDAAGDAAIGLLGEWEGSEFPFGGFQSQPFGWMFGIGLWSRCPECSSLAVTHEYMSYQRRPCSHYDGSQWTIDNKEVEFVACQWKRACNEVQWRRSR